MKKRILSMLLMLTMVFSLIVVPNSAVAVTYYDTVDTDCELAVDVLDALGIMGGYTDGSFLPYNPITKAEMASVAVKLAGIDGVDEEAPDDMELFNDMYDYEGWAAGVVAMAKAAGIARSDEDGNFYPDMSATYEDAVQMVVSALGYGHQAQVRGDELKDYVYVGQKLGITKKLDTGMGQNITRADVAKLVYAALTVDIMLPVSYSGDGTMVKYEAVKGKNALNSFFEVREVNGIIAENEYAAIDGDTTVEEEQVLINDEVFNVGYTNIADYLGYYATVFAMDAEDSSENRTIIAYTTKSVKNNTLTIESADIESVSYSATEGYTVEYWANRDTDKKTKEITTSSTPYVLYNGKAIIDVTADLISPDNGHVVFIDNNGDDDYDIVDVWEYELVYVYSVSQSSGKVTNSYDRSATGAHSFNPDDDDYHVTFLNAYGGIAQLSDIKQDSVLYVYETLEEQGKAEKKVVISNNRISGMVSEASDEGYVINGTEYEISPAVAGRLELAVSDEGEFYLDADNRIAGFEGTSVIRKNIGVFIDINDGGLRNGYQVKVLTQNSGVMIYNLASSIKVNNRPDKVSAADFYSNAFTDEYFGSAVNSGLNYGNMDRPNPARAGFLYKLNKKGEICEVIVVGDGDGDGYLQTRIIGTKHENKEDSTQLYYSKNYHCLHYSGETVQDIETKKWVGARTYCDNKTTTFLMEEADYKNDNQSFFVRGMDYYWDNYRFNIYDKIYAYYYSEDGSEVNKQKTVSNFLVMANKYVETTEAEDKKNDYATYYQPDVAPKFIHKITEAYDKSTGEKTVRVYYFDGTSLRNQLVKPMFFQPGDNGNEGYIDENPENGFLPSGLPVRISTDGNYIEDIAPFYDKGNGIYYDMYEAVNPIFNESTNTYVTPFKPFCQYQSRPWNWNESEYQIRHYCGIITGIDEVVGNKLFSLSYATSESSGENGKVYGIDSLPDERLEGNVYKMNFDRSGNISSITRGTLEDIVPGQLVIVRKRAWSNTHPNWDSLTGYAVNEFFILSDDASELDYLSDFYDQVQKKLAEDAK